MLIDLRMQATVESVLITSTVARFTHQIPNRILIDTANRTLYAIGRTAEEIATDSPETWANRPQTMTFFPAYSSSDFRIIYTYGVLRFYAFAVHNAIRSQWSGLWLGRYDRFALDLQLEGYEQIGQSAKDELVYELFMNRWGYQAKVAILRINGESIHGPKPDLLRARRWQRLRRSLARW